MSLCFGVIGAVVATYKCSMVVELQSQQQAWVLD
jgi:hypothetical protein